MLEFPEFTAIGEHYLQLQNIYVGKPTIDKPLSPNSFTQVGNRIWITLDVGALRLAGVEGDVERAAKNLCARLKYVEDTRITPEESNRGTLYYINMPCNHLSLTRMQTLVERAEIGLPRIIEDRATEALLGNIRETGKELAQIFGEKESRGALIRVVDRSLVGTGLPPMQTEKYQPRI